MKNIKQSASLPVWRCMKNKLPEELIPELTAVSTTVYETNDDRNKAVNELIAKFPSEIRKDLKSFGKELPTDNIDLTVSLGSFLFDMYCCVEKAPTAPLARLVYQKRLMEVADVLNKEEFEIPDQAVNQIKQVLLNDQEWQQAAIVATYEYVRGEEKTTKEVVLKTSVAGLFGDIVQAAAEAMHNLENSSK